MALRPVSASFQVRTAVRSKSSFNSCAPLIRLASSGLPLSPRTGAGAAAASQERPVLRVQTSARLCWWNSSWFTCARSLRRPGGNLFNQFIAPRHAFRQTPAQQDEIHLPLLLAPVVEGTETGAGLRHHVERQPGTIGFAVASLTYVCRHSLLAGHLDRVGDQALLDRVVDLGKAHHRHVHSAPRHGSSCDFRAFTRIWVVGIEMILGCGLTWSSIAHSGSGSDEERAVRSDERGAERSEEHTSE